MVARFVIIDGSSYFFRAFYAVPRLTNSKGMPTNAVKGFHSMLKRVLRRFHPDHIVVVFDAAEKTFRNEIYRDYKAHRQPLPEELGRQIPIIKELPRAYNIQTLEMQGYEADDIIGTLAVEAVKKGMEACIVTADKDLMQLVTKRATDETTPGIVLYDDRDDRRVGIDEVVAKFEVPPERVVDVLALMGDASDNVPGVEGVGEKTARELIKKFGSVEHLLENAHRIEREKLRQKIIEGKENALLSKKLVTLVTNLPIPFEPDTFRRVPENRERLRELFRELEFASELRELEGGGAPVVTGSFTHRLVTSEADLRAFAGRVKDALALKIFGTAGIALYGGEAVYVPMGHQLLDAGPQVPGALEILRPLLEDPDVRKLGHDLKTDSTFLARRGIELRGLAMDAMLGSWLLNPDSGSHEISRLAQEHLSMEIRRPEDVTGKGRKFVDFPYLAPSAVAPYACEAVSVIARVSEILERKLGALSKLLHEMELPLVGVLRDMEMAGVRIDTQVLRALSEEFEAKLKVLERECHELAGTPFNVNSPQQLAEVLYDRLKLPVVKRTETGRSTDASVLEELSDRHPLPAKVLEYRSMAKLKGTYIDTLPLLVDPKTGRVHTSYHQTGTATGRLSSSDPNLQNIPVRGEEGQMIRRAFVAEPGHQLVVADYSQIELRLLAHFSKDEVLLRAYREGKDIHALTASEIFQVPQDQVTPDMRRKAKAVNFGIVYGISPFGLAQQLGIPSSEAKKYIERYFAWYQGVRAFIDRLLAEARSRGYVETLFGRRRYIVGLDSRNSTVRGHAERAAMNAPLQGTAADLMKVAMIRIHRALRPMRSRLILQVHDELVVEAPDAEVEQAKEILKREMESAARLEVPLLADVHAGRNWADAKR